MKSEFLPVTMLSANDNVVVALKELPAGSRISREGIACRETIPSGHKAAVKSISKGASVLKYGQIIGSALKDIEPGDWVHTHNLAFSEHVQSYEPGVDARPISYFPEEKRAFFEGIVRPDGRVATRNYIGVLSTVSCSHGVAQLIADTANRESLADYPDVDGVIAIGHGSGCALTPDGEGMVNLQNALAGWARHPNFAGMVVVGLGCEVNHIDCLMDNMNLRSQPGLTAFSIQEAGGTKKTVQRGVEAIKAFLPKANQIKREKVSASHLILGLECGGSDAYSGITANPALGAASDLLVRHGGTAVLSETSEIYGAEHLLVRRAANKEIGEKLLDRIRWWRDYTQRNRASLNNNPSPGNKAGGLTTILEKSLGAVAKGGSTNLIDVYRYAEPVKAKGFVFMDTPGYDVVSLTGMIAGGANVCCFTTGRGSVFGSKPVPTLKLATNSEMYERIKEDMDIDCGRILKGDTSIAEMGRLIFEMILETASGKRTKSEQFGFNVSEFVPWEIGAVL